MIDIDWFTTWKCCNYRQVAGCEVCPYCVHREYVQSRTEDKRSSLLSNHIDPDNIIGFLGTNIDIFHRQLEIAGGEPLLLFHLPYVLDEVGKMGYKWYLTSCMQIPVEDMIENSGIENCSGWSASWHPFSKEMAKFTRNVNLIRNRVNGFKINIVASHHTIDILEDAIRFCKQFKCPIHIIKETYRLSDVDLFNRIDTITRRNNVDFIHYERRNYNGMSICNTHDKFIIIAPDGNLYPCSSCMEKEIESVGIVDSNLDVTNIPKMVRRCLMSKFRKPGEYEFIDRCFCDRKTKWEAPKEEPKKTKYKLI